MIYVMEDPLKHTKTEIKILIVNDFFLFGLQEFKIVKPLISILTQTHTVKVFGIYMYFKRF